MNREFPSTRASAAREVGEYRSTHGVQVVAVLNGERVLDLALGDDGTGAPIAGETIFRAYCTIKPVLATLIARLIDDGALGLDDPLETALGNLPVVADGLTLRHLLTHTAGLQRPMGFEMELVPPGRRREVLEEMSRAPDFRLGVDAAYSEYAAWNIAGWAVEAATGAPLGETLRTWISSVGLHDTWLGMSPDEYRDQRDRIGVSFDRRGSSPMPMLLERGKRWCTEVNPAHGGYTTARDLGTFYASLLDRLDGAELDTLPDAATLRMFCSTVRAPVFDQVLDRVCPFGLGFMTELSEHAFGDAPGPAAFGHSGYAGASFALADPDHGLTVAAIFNGIVAYQEAFQRRTDLLRSIYADLGFAAPARFEEDRG
jgi:CubicO group peptidase (beta-lactamase class C family)